MSGLFKIFLSLSLSGSLLIAILLLCMPLYKNKLSKRWQYYIWLIVIARLLLPYTPEASPVGSLFQEVDRLPPLMIQMRQSVDAPHVKEAAAASAAPSSQAIQDTVLKNLWLVWLMFALILLVRKVTVYQSFVRYVKAGRTAVTDTELLDRLAELGAQNGVQRPVELYTNSLVSSPMLLGFFCPCIVLPSVGLSDFDFRNTVLHELTHYKRKDMFYKWLVQITICLHWFNPLVYLMGREVSRSCELACDEAVMNRLAAEERRSYGDTLLNAAGSESVYKNGAVSVTMYESKKLLRERLEAIKQYKRTPKSLASLAVLCSLFLGAGAAALGACSAPSTKSPVSRASGTASQEPAISQAPVGSQDPAVAQAPPEFQDPTVPQAPVASQDPAVPQAPVRSQDPAVAQAPISQPISSTTAESGRDSEDAGYTYMQRSFYGDPYIFEMGWNIKEQDKVFFPNVTNTVKKTILLSDQTKITAAFDSACSDFAQNDAVLSSLKNVIDQVKPLFAEALPLETPLILNITEAGSDANRLAEEYYSDNNVGNFSAVFPFLDAETQKTYCDKMFEDNENACFAAVLWLMDQNSISTFAEKAYAEDRTNFFAVIVPFLSDEEKQAWTERCTREKQSAFLAVISHLSQ